MELTLESQVTFQDFPAEIFEIIFVGALPDDVLDQKQPNTKIAPMLLCHICSQWRSIALQLPRLWMCLYHFIRIPPCMSYGSVVPVPLNKRIRPNAAEFLQWWWCNLSVNRSFHFRCDGRFEGWYVHPDVEDEWPDEEQILFTLFDLAQHLDNRREYSAYNSGYPPLANACKSGNASHPQYFDCLWPTFPSPR